MSLKNISDQSLHNNLIALCNREREIVAEIVQHLCEVKRRRLYADYKCDGLFAYCTKILRYSDGEAWTRIKAAQLLEERPTLLSSFESGKLSLTNAAQAKHLLDQLHFSEEKKNDLIESVMDKSTRVVKAELNAIAVSENLKKSQSEKTRRTATQANKTILKMTLEDEEVKNLDFLKSKLNIKDDKILISRLLKNERERLDPGAKVVVAKVGRKISLPRSISPAKKHEVYKKAGSKCEQCGSVYALNIEHVRPVALGGGNELGNLKLLCRSCNGRSGIKVFGAQLMERYLS